VSSGVGKIFGKRTSHKKSPYKGEKLIIYGGSSDTI